MNEKPNTLLSLLIWTAAQHEMPHSALMSPSSDHKIARARRLFIREALNFGWSYDEVADILNRTVSQIKFINWHFNRQEMTSESRTLLTFGLDEKEVATLASVAQPGETPSQTGARLLQMGLQTIQMQVAQAQAQAQAKAQPEVKAASPARSGPEEIYG